MIDEKVVLQLMRIRFTQLQMNQIERLHQEDLSFQEICQNYADCLQMRDKYASDITDRNAIQYRKDYERLIEALEAEIFEILRAHSEPE